MDWSWRNLQGCAGTRIYRLPWWFWFVQPRLGSPKGREGRSSTAREKSPTYSGIARSSAWDASTFVGGDYAWRHSIQLLRWQRYGGCRRRHEACKALYSQEWLYCLSARLPW